MNTIDDPRQVLAILNSLGVVGVTALELKAFMKELKLYRKIKEQETEKWKEETKAKILRKYQLLEIHKTDTRQSRVLREQNQTVHKQDNKKKTTKSDNRNCFEIIIDRKAHRNIDRNKENDVEETISTLAVSFENCRTRAPSTKSDNACLKKLDNACLIKLDNACLKKSDNACLKKFDNARFKKSDKVKERPVSAPQIETKTVDRPSRKRTKSITSTEPRSQSVHLRSRSKSFIRSPQSRPESRASGQMKRGPSDPVALYNKYKKIWDQLSLPGEQNHAKLRWAVREKMMGTEPYPKPVVQLKKPARSSSSKGKRN